MKIKQGDRVKRLISILGFVGLAWASGPDLDRAHKLYNLTEFRQSLEVLQAVPNKDAAVYELMGRNYYGEGEFKRATEALEKAVALEPDNSGFHLWLGRAYGRRAETSSMITAPGLANKARQFFEKAVQLNPANLEAQSDLL
jgi:cytochrome c-type biogenesis protein CcmH/NrfG